MIQTFKSQGTEDIFNGLNTPEARRTCPNSVWNRAARKLDMIDSAERLEDLLVPPGNRLESLSGNRSGQYSIRVNDRYRVCFRWTDSGACDIEIVDYH
jgi:proteic killer suppression protein